jgi:hypothetical protein
LGLKRHPLGGLIVVVCCASDRILFSPLGLDMQFAWERYFSYLLNLLPYSWYVMIYSWRHSVPVLTWLTVIASSWGHLMWIFQHSRLIGQNNVPSWHGVWHVLTYNL